MNQLVLGIDIGGTNSVYGFVDHLGNVLLERTIPTQKYEDVELYVQAFYDDVQVGLHQLNNSISLVGIGIGAPDANYYHGTIENASNLAWKGIVKLKSLFEQKFNLPTAITNDANAAAIGEMIFGGAKNLNDFMVITLGTGLGSGIVVNGEVVYGYTGVAGEMGHVIITPNGRLCGCGRRGCLETYVSATGIKRTFYEVLSNHNGNSTLRDVSYDALTAKMIADAARDGDIVALESFQKTGETLGLALANAVVYTSPEAIFLFGGLAQAGELIFEPTRKSLNENMLILFKDSVKLLPSEIDNANAAVLGASALIWNELHKKNNELVKA